MVHEQLDRFVRKRLLRAHRHALGRHSHTGNRHDPFARDRERLAARREHPHVPTTSQYLACNVGGPGNHLFAVVEYEQRLARREPEDHRFERCPCRGFTQAEIGEYLRRDVCVRGNRSQLDVPHAVRETFEHVRCDVQRRARLADAPGRRERHEACLGE